MFTAKLIGKGECDLCEKDTEVYEVKMKGKDWVMCLPCLKKREKRAFEKAKPKTPPKVEAK